MPADEKKIFDTPKSSRYAVSKPYQRPDQALPISASDRSLIPQRIPTRRHLARVRPSNPFPMPRGLGGHSAICAAHRPACRITQATWKERVDETIKAEPHQTSLREGLSVGPRRSLQRELSLFNRTRSRKVAGRLERGSQRLARGAHRRSDML